MRKPVLPAAHSHHVTITISDGISMGSEGMMYSLVSREVIADSIETVEGGDGTKAIPSPLPQREGRGSG